jgi:hypothetical protein
MKHYLTLLRMVTKFKSLTAIALVALTVLIYSACKKDVTAVKTDNDQKIAISIANNLYKSVTNLAGQNTKNTLPVTNSVRNGKKVNDLTCGEYIEVPYNNVYTKGDSVKDVMTGTDKYVVACDGGNKLNGYTYTGAYVNTGFSPYAIYDNSVKEYYTLAALLPEFAKMQISGTQTSVYKVTTKKDGEYMVQNNSYVLKNLVIDASNRPFDILSGSANYVSNGTNAGVNFSYSGSITFLGNHKATLVLNGKSFDIPIQ